MSTFTGKVALVTGGSSGIGRTTAIAFAQQGANVVIVGRSEADGQETVRLIQEAGTDGLFINADLTQAAAVEASVNQAVEKFGRLDCSFNNAAIETTCKYVEKHGQRCLKIKADVRFKNQCEAAVKETVAQLGKLNILVNNAAYQTPITDFVGITEEHLRRVFDTNIIGYFFMAQAALPHLSEGDAIVNTGSTTALVGNPVLVDYSATKGVIHVFTKSLALNLADRKIRVNAVVPEPVWTPLILTAAPDPDAVSKFSSQSAMQRPGQPEELAPAYVLLASSDGSFMTGSLVEVSGGIVTVG